MLKHEQLVSGSLRRLEKLGEKARIALAIGALAVTLAAEASSVQASPNSKLDTPEIAHANEFEASRGETVKSVTTKNHAVYINGKPTFLFGVWAPNDDWAVKELGVNVLIAAGPDTTSERLAQSVEGRAWVLRYSYPGMTLGEPFPNQIGTAWYDEPIGNGISAGFLSNTPQDGRLNYQNYPSPFGGLAVGNKAAVADYMPYLANLGPKAAVTYDFYVNNGISSIEDPKLHGVGTDYHWTLAVKKALGANSAAPFGAYIETTNWEKGSRPLTRRQVVGKAKAGITGGSNIINWWDRKGDVAPNSTSPDIASGIRQFTDEVHRLAPILLAEQMEGVDSTWEDLIKVGGRITKGKDGKPVYNMILFNSTGRAMTLQKKLPGLTNQTVKEVISGRTSTARNGRIKTTIGPYDWVIESYKPVKTA